jgi:hypothetical protein
MDVRSSDAGDETAVNKIARREKKYGFDRDKYSLKWLFLLA